MVPGFDLVSVVGPGPKLRNRVFSVMPSYTCTIVIFRLYRVYLLVYGIFSEFKIYIVDVMYDVDVMMS